MTRFPKGAKINLMLGIRYIPKGDFTIFGDTRYSRYV